MSCDIGIGLKSSDSVNILKMTTLSEEYLNFRSSISLKKICIGEEQTWSLYDAGPRAVTSPIIFLPPASGRADVYFMQLSCLSKLGYRAISVEYPVLWTVRDFCLGFNKLLNALNLGQIHLFGSAIGGFLAMKFAQFSKSANRVRSIVLCNSFTDSSIFGSRFPVIPPAIFWILPSVVLRKLVMSDFKSSEGCDPPTKYSMDFLRHSLDSLNQEELASRLVLNCTNDYIQPQYLRDVSVMIVEVNNCHALDQMVLDETQKCFPNAKLAQLKSGGNFPFISRAEDINIFIQIHMKPYLTLKGCSPISGDNILTSIVREAEALLVPSVTSPFEQDETLQPDAAVKNQEPASSSNISAAHQNDLQSMPPKSLGNSETVQVNIERSDDQPSASYPA